MSDTKYDKIEPSTPYSYQQSQHAGVALDKPFLTSQWASCDVTAQTRRNITTITRRTIQTSTKRSHRVNSCHGSLKIRYGICWDELCDRMVWLGLSICEETSDARVAL